jgi:hypothetical protein
MCGRKYVRTNPKNAKKAPKSVRKRVGSLSKMGPQLQRGGAKASKGVKACADNFIPKLFYSSAGRGDGGKSLAIKDK